MAWPSIEEREARRLVLAFADAVEALAESRRRYLRAGERAKANGATHQIGVLQRKIRKLIQRYPRAARPRRSSGSKATGSSGPSTR